MDKNKKAIEELQKGIAKFCLNAIANAPFTKIITGRILEINGNKSKVLSDGIEYNNVPKLSNISIEVGDIVKIVVPQNNYNNIYIEGKLG